MRPQPDPNSTLRLSSVQKTGLSAASDTAFAGREQRGDGRAPDEAGRNRSGEDDPARGGFAGPEQPELMAGEIENAKADQREVDDPVDVEDHGREMAEEEEEEVRRFQREKMERRKAQHAPERPARERGGAARFGGSGGGRHWETMEAGRGREGQQQTENGAGMGGAGFGVPPSGGEGGDNACGSILPVACHCTARAA